MKSTKSQKDIEGTILNAYNVLLARYGYRKITMDDLAEQAGIGKNTIYLHFRSKEDLVYTHVDRVIGRVLEQLQEIAESNLSPIEKIREMMLTRVIFRFDSVQYFPESLSEMFRDLRAGVLQRREYYFKEEAKLFSAVLKQGQRTGDIRPGDCLTTANVLLAATNSLLPFNLSTRELGSRREIATMATRIADLLLEGLVKKKGPAARRS